MGSSAPAEAGHELAPHPAGVLGPGERVSLAARGGPTRLLLLAARPLNEPVVQYGPFVMNSRSEIEQALADYQAGLADAPHAFVVGYKGITVPQVTELRLI